MPNCESPISLGFLFFFFFPLLSFPPQQTTTITLSLSPFSSSRLADPSWSGRRSPPRPRLRWRPSTPTSPGPRSARLAQLCAVASASSSSQTLPRTPPHGLRREPPREISELGSSPSPRPAQAFAAPAQHSPAPAPCAVGLADVPFCAPPLRATPASFARASLGLLRPSPSSCALS